MKNICTQNESHALIIADKFLHLGKLDPKSDIARAIIRIKVSLGNSQLVSYIGDHTPQVSRCLGKYKLKC